LVIPISKFMKYVCDVDKLPLFSLNSRSCIKNNSLLLLELVKDGSDVYAIFCDTQLSKPFCVKVNELKKYVKAYKFSNIDLTEDNKVVLGSSKVYKEKYVDVIEEKDNVEDDFGKKVFESKIKDSIGRLIALSKLNSNTEKLEKMVMKMASQYTHNKVDLLKVLIYITEHELPLTFAVGAEKDDRGAYHKIDFHNLNSNFLNFDFKILTVDKMSNISSDIRLIAASISSSEVFSVDLYWFFRNANFLQYIRIGSGIKKESSVNGRHLHQIYNDAKSLAISSPYYKVSSIDEYRKNMGINLVSYDEDVLYFDSDSFGDVLNAEEVSIALLHTNSIIYIRDSVKHIRKFSDKIAFLYNVSYVVIESLSALSSGLIDACIEYNIGLICPESGFMMKRVLSLGEDIKINYLTDDEVKQVESRVNKYLMGKSKKSIQIQLQEQIQYSRLTRTFFEKAETGVLNVYFTDSGITEIDDSSNKVAFLNKFKSELYEDLTMFSINRWAGNRINVIVARKVLYLLTEKESGKPTEIEQWLIADINEELQCAIENKGVTISEKLANLCSLAIFNFYCTTEDKNHLFLYDKRCCRDHKECTTLNLYMVSVKTYVSRIENILENVDAKYKVLKSNVKRLEELMNVYFTIIANTYKFTKAFGVYRAATKFNKGSVPWATKYSVEFLIQEVNITKWVGKMELLNLTLKNYKNCRGTTVLENFICNFINFEINNFKFLNTWSTYQFEALDYTSEVTANKFGYTFNSKKQGLVVNSWYATNQGAKYLDTGLSLDFKIGRKSAINYLKESMKTLGDLLYCRYVLKFVKDYSLEKSSDKCNTVKCSYYISAINMLLVIMGSFNSELAEKIKNCCLYYMKDAKDEITYKCISIDKKEYKELSIFYNTGGLFIGNYKVIGYSYCKKSFIQIARDYYEVDSDTTEFEMLRDSVAPKFFNELLTNNYFSGIEDLLSRMYGIEEEIMVC